MAKKVSAKSKIKEGEAAQPQADPAAELAARLGTPPDPIPGAQVQPPDAEPAEPTSKVVNMHERRPKPSEEELILRQVKLVSAYMVQSMGLDEDAAYEMAAGLEPDQLRTLYDEAQAAGEPKGVPLKPTSGVKAPGTAVGSKVVPANSVMDDVQLTEFNEICADHRKRKAEMDKLQQQIDDLNADIMARLAMFNTKSLGLVLDDRPLRVTGYYGVNVQLSKTRLMEQGVDPTIIANATVRTPNQRPTVQIVDAGAPDHSGDSRG